MNTDILLKRYIARLRDDGKYMPRLSKCENALDAGYALYNILEHNMKDIVEHINSTLLYLDEQKCNTWDNFSFSFHKGFRQVDIIEDNCYLNSVIWSLLQVTDSFWETLHILYDGNEDENAYVWDDKYTDAQVLSNNKNRIKRLKKLYKKEKNIIDRNKSLDTVA